MSARQALWAMGLLVVLFGGLAIFRRVRGRTDDYRQTAVYKQRLPMWLGQFERAALGLLLAATIMIVLKADLGLRARFATGGGATTGVAAIYFVLGLFMIALPVAMLGANLLSWLFPPARRANLKAMEGLSVSFWTLNRGLLLFSAATVPFGTLLLALSEVEPWR